MKSENPMIAMKAARQTLMGGEKLHIRRLGPFWVAVSDRDGVIGRTNSEEKAVDLLRLAAHAERQCEAWKNIAINERFPIGDNAFLSILKQPDGKARVDVLDKSQPSNKQLAAKIFDINICKWREAVAIGEIFATGVLEFREPLYADIAVSETNRILGMKVGPKLNDVKLTPWVYNFWRKRNASGALPNFGAIMTRFKEVRTHLNTLINLQEFVNVPATAAIAKKLEWPMKAIVDKSGEVVECWMEAPDGCQFDGVEFLPAGAMESDMEPDCSIVDVDPSKVSVLPEDYQYVNAVRRLLSEDVLRHSAEPPPTP